MAKDKKIQITYQQDEREEKAFFDAGVKVSDIVAKIYHGKCDVMAVLLNNTLKELSYHVNEDAELEFVTTDSTMGYDMYKRSEILLMLSAFYKVEYSKRPDLVIDVMYSVGKGFFCRVKNEDYVVTDEVLAKVKAEMQKMVDEKAVIEKKTVNTSDAIEDFEARGLMGKAKLFRYRRSSRMNMYTLSGFSDYFYGYMVPNAGYLKEFDLVKYDDGFVLIVPTKSSMKVEEYKAPDKLYRLLRQTEDWGDKLGVDGVGDLNDVVVNGDINQLMLVQEALMEKQIADIAETIRKENKKIILIAGPSSSGKTTFSNRLSIQLIAHGLHPHPIAMDNFFKERSETPKDENGKYDFECLGAVDLDLFNKDMQDLLDGKTVDMPTFDFVMGEKTYPGDMLHMNEGDVLVVEGIHALNPASTEALPKESCFKIYISALTQLNIDEHNRISTTDTRLLRRIVRDARTRGNDAAKTIAMWPSVRRGEEMNIFPFQEEADVMFNSAMIYELSAIKTFVEPLLFGVKPGTDEYYEAKRLLKFLDYFLGIDASILPQNSLMREFIGGGCFKV